MPPEDEDRAERAAHQAESERQNADDRCSEPVDPIVAISQWLAEEVAWNRGASYPWEGMALIEPQLLADLAALAAQYAPQREIHRLMSGEHFAEINEDD